MDIRKNLRRVLETCGVVIMSNVSNVKVERGFFEPSQSMLKLTEVFIEKLTEACRARQVPYQHHKQSDISTIHKIGNDVYELNNNGVVASWSFLGFSN